MPTQLPAGPYRNFTLDNGVNVPFYVIPFDKEGICEGPETRQRLINDVAQGVFTDLFLFSHGWNTDWSSAISAYEKFMQGFINLRRQHNLTIQGPYRPLLVGIFWPSVALVFGEDEVGPAIAAVDPAAMDQAVAVEREAVRNLAERLPAKDRPRFYELVQKASLSEAEALELAKLTRVFYRGQDDETGESGRITAKAMVNLWRSTAPKPTDEEGDDFGTVGGSAGGPEAAAGFGSFDPRNIVRVLTIYQMKDRAGVVGAHGVGPLIRDLLAAKDVRIHLIGHSFGGRVMLSAIAGGGALPAGRKVDSLLLLQPAVNHLCFAEKVTNTGKPGGYREVLNRVRKPILSTFSAQDIPLHTLFHLAVRRGRDLGEAQIAAGGEHPDPPSRFAALGGYGPRGSGESLIHIKTLPDAYDLATNVRIYGVNGKGKITSHGDVSNEATWWALYCLVSAGRT